MIPQSIAGKDVLRLMITEGRLCFLNLLLADGCAFSHFVLSKHFLSRGWTAEIADCTQNALQLLHVRFVQLGVHVLHVVGVH